VQTEHLSIFDTDVSYITRTWVHPMSISLGYPDICHPGKQRFAWIDPRLCGEMFQHRGCADNCKHLAFNQGRFLFTDGLDAKSTRAHTHR